MGVFWFKIQFRNLQKVRLKLKNAPLKFQKLKTYLRRPIKKREGTNRPRCKPSAEARKRVAVGHLNLLVQINYTLFYKEKAYENTETQFGQVLRTFLRLKSPYFFSCLEVEILRLYISFFRKYLGSISVYFLAKNDRIFVNFG